MDSKVFIIIHYWQDWHEGDTRQKPFDYKFYTSKEAAAEAVEKGVKEYEEEEGITPDLEIIEFEKA